MFFGDWDVSTLLAFFFFSPEAALPDFCWVPPDFLFFFPARSGACPYKKDVIDERKAILLS